MQKSPKGTVRNGARRLGRLARLVGSAFVAFFLAAATAKADRPEPPLLLGGPQAPVPHVIETDPRLPTGAAISASDRPRGGERTCSVTLPVCVHAARGVDAERAFAGLAALELAFRRVVRGLELPPPLADDGRGGTDALDLYLSPPDRTTPGFERVHTHADPRRPDGFDRASGFCTALADEPFLLERAATLCVGEAIALRLDPGETPDLRRAFATELWWMVGSPTSLDYEAVAEVQERPWAAMASRELSAASEGRALLLEYLTERLGTGYPADLATALFSLSAQTTPADSAAWHNEPDWFDVIRHTLGGGEAKMASLLGDFAVARAFLGEHQDGLHLPSLAWASHAGTPRFDWVIPFKSLPRRVRLTPVEPTGASLVWLDLAGAPQGFTLGFQADWEPPAEFQWVIVQVGKDGETQRLEVPFQERETRVEARVINIHDVRAIIGAGAHLERVGADHPFDPDVAPFEPHGGYVYLVEL
jgi:hypothetical protein